MLGPSNSTAFHATPTPATIKKGILQTLFLENRRNTKVFKFIYEYHIRISWKNSAKIFAAVNGLNRFSPIHRGGPCRVETKMHFSIFTKMRKACENFRSVSYYPIMRNSVQSKIPQHSAAFRDTEFRIIPRNFRQFRMAYGIYGSNKNVRNSVLTESRGHPTQHRPTLMCIVQCACGGGGGGGCKVI
jgi:hypothetical protein